MSYRKKFERKVKADYSASIYVSLPVTATDEMIKGVSVEIESENVKKTFKGIGWFTLNDYAEEDVEVQIDVDTAPFDSSVRVCNNQVSGLTASVETLNSAQCVAISENAEKVSKTIIDGFFHTIRTDLSAQKAELEQAVEARLMLLREQATSLQEKQKSLSESYARTSARYKKLFDDLNNELSSRIHQIDQPVFNLVKDVDKHSDRMLHTDMVQAAVTMSKESSLLQEQIRSAAVKHHALQAMGQLQEFLTLKALSEKSIKSSCVEGRGNEGYLVPICYMKTESEGNQIEQLCEIPGDYSSKNPKLKELLCERLEETELEEMDANEKEQLKSYVQSEMDDNIVNNDEHSDRVRAIINRMLNN